MYGTTVANADTMLSRIYWGTLGTVLCLGFVINFIMVKTIPASAVLSINSWVLIIGYFVCCIAGITLSKVSDNPIISFIGYLMVVVPVGIIIIPFVQKFDPMIVQKAALFTAILTGIMAIGGFMFPAFFASLGGILFWALLAAIIAEVAMFLLGYELKIMDWIVSVIFLGFIGYDFAMALEDEATIDAAVDRAVALYLDIINVFIRVLSIIGGDD